MNPATKQYKSKISAIPDENHLTGQQCFNQLLDLSLVALNLPFHQLSTKLYSITSTTVRSEHVEYVDRNGVTVISRVWDATLVSTVISVAKETVNTMYKKMLASDLSKEQFDPDKMELEARRVMFFIETLHRKYELRSNYHHDLMMDYYHPREVLGFVPQSLKILRIIKRKIRFQKAPSLTKPVSTLWNTIHRAESISAFLDANCEAVCPACRVEEINEGGNFAITDCYHHLVCIKCAKKLFDVRHFQQSLCPSCNRTVKAWTDKEHFHKFKETLDAKTAFWRLIHGKTLLGPKLGPKERI